MTRPRAALALAALLSVAAGVASAQSARQKIDDLASRLEQLEQVVQGQALVELSQKVESLTNEVRALRGELEVVQNENAELRKQQVAALADFDRRLAATGSHAAVAVSAPPPAVPEPPPPPPPPVVETTTPEQRYGRAFDALKAGDYAAAIAGMRDFIARHPDHPLADNAYYWLGQTHYLNRDYVQAIEAFASVGSKSPDSAKAPDALLKRGLSELELKRGEAARRSFNDLIARYPASEAARLAREQLQRLR
ncbi:MAG: tol-pal system protein YbgF [Gammaproteobacteria bacterium]|nr:tol-pal system protein YbgF [Gammaproteobacteria bacterium]